MLQNIMPTASVEAVTSGRSHEGSDMIHMALPLASTSVAESAQSVLQTGGRFLLTLSMALFVSYLLFLVGAVVLSALMNLVGSVPARLDERRKPRRHAVRRSPGAAAPAAPRTEDDRPGGDVGEPSTPEAQVPVPEAGAPLDAAALDRARAA